MARRKSKYVFSTEAPVKFTKEDQKVFYGQRQYDTMLLMHELWYWTARISDDPEEAQAHIQAIWFALYRIVPIGQKAAAIAEDAFEKGERSAVKNPVWVEDGRSYYRRGRKKKEPSAIEKQIEKDKEDLRMLVVGLICKIGNLGKVQPEDAKALREQMEQDEDQDRIDAEASDLLNDLDINWGDD